jgi:hypothetical protein
VVSIFKEKSTPAVLGLVFLAVVVHAPFFYKPPNITALETDGLLYYFLNPLTQLPGVILAGLYYAVVLVQALRINYVLNDARMYQKTAFTASLGYILLTALLPAWCNISPALVVNSFIIWLLFRMVKLPNASRPKTIVYNIGLITGSIVLLYYPSICIIPVVFFALGVTRPFKLNEWFVLLMGIITPAYFWCGYLFLTGQLSALKVVAGIFSLQKILPANVQVTGVAFAAAGLLIIAGIFGWRAYNNRMQIQVRKMWSVLFIMLLLFIPSILIIKNAWPAALLLACVPGATFAGSTFLYQKRLIAALFFWLTIAAIIYVNWQTFKI